MAHYVNRRGYWSLEESFREGKRVRKRVLEYYGKRKPFNILTDVDWQYTMRGDGAVFNAGWNASTKTAVEPVPASQPNTVSTPESSPDDVEDAQVVPSENEPGGEVSGGS